MITLIFSCIYKPSKEACIVRFYALEVSMAVYTNKDNTVIRCTDFFFPVSDFCLFKSTLQYLNWKKKKIVYLNIICILSICGWNKYQNPGAHVYITFCAAEGERVLKQHMNPNHLFNHYSIFTPFLKFSRRTRYFYRWPFICFQLEIFTY